ncbi:MAG TPA: ATP synthase F1 subunit gamma [bacterium]
MASLRDIRRRIKSVKNTQQITKAMKMVSAAKLRRAQERALAYRDYADGVREVAVHLAELGGAEGNPLAESRETKQIDLIVVTSDKGLCGSFNSNVLNAASRFIRERAGMPVGVVAVGKKSRDFARRRGWEIAGEHLDTFRGVNRALAVAIAGQATGRFLEGQSDEVWLLYNEFVSVIAQKVVLRRLLPLEGAGEGEAAGDAIFEPDRASIAAQLFPELVTSQVFRALLESSASEHGARMAAMDAASRNAGEMIAKLTLTYNRARQAVITKELIEVVSGADALAG